MRVERAELVAYIVIAMGLILLVITFIMAYLRLESLQQKRSLTVLGKT
ncbi:MAG: hypothetical protein ACP5JW_08240 [Candidatus Bathyarchaeia archaeon]